MLNNCYLISVKDNNFEVINTLLTRNFKKQLYKLSNYCAKVLNICKKLPFKVKKKDFTFGKTCFK